MTKQLRWRTFPVGIIGGFGVIFLAFGVFGFIHLVYVLLAGRPMYTPGPSQSDSLKLGVVGVALGLWLLFAALQWWRRHWWRAVFMIGAIFVLHQIGSATGMISE